MNAYQDDYIQYRLTRAREALRAAKLLADAKEYNSCVNRLYYAVFYAINALLLKHEYTSSKHTGVRALFMQHFVKTRIIPEQYGELFNYLFDYRQESDYRDLFVPDPDKILPLLSQAEELLDFITDKLAE